MAPSSPPRRPNRIKAPPLIRPPQGKRRRVCAFGCGAVGVHRTMPGVSLTGELRDADSDVARFFAEHLPDVARATSALRQWAAHLREPVRPASGCPTPAWVLGHTIDHRIRVSLGAAYGDPVAYGIKRLWPSGEGVRDAVQRVGAELLGELDGFSGAPLLLDGADGDRLIRLCVVSSYFENVFRSGRCDHGDPLDRLTATTTLTGLLDQVPRAAVADITAQLRLAAHDDALGWLVGQEVLCGPEFAGSTHIGGADADWVYDGDLIDCKSTVAPDRLGRRELYQLAGYVLLDFDDRYKIRCVRLYLSRQGALLTWHLPEYLRLLGARGTLRDLRAALQDLIAPPAARVCVGPTPDWAVKCPSCRAAPETACVTPAGAPSRTTHAPRRTRAARRAP